jgi:hypothetical protein
MKTSIPSPDLLLKGFLGKTWQSLSLSSHLIKEFYGAWREMELLNEVGNAANEKGS